MGYYIETPQHLEKAMQLVKLHGGTIVPKPQSLADVPVDKALICVIQNGLFDAAGLVYSESEFRAFADSSDWRPKTFVLLDKKLAQTLSGYTG
jgi:hypothetical protein